MKKSFTKLLAAAIVMLMVFSMFSTVSFGAEKVVKTIDNCDAVDGWQANGPLEVDTDKKEGAGSLKTSSDAALILQKPLSTPIDLSAFKNADVSLEFWVYLENRDIATEGQVELTSAGAPDQNEYSWPMQAYQTDSGWTKVSVKLSEATITGGDPDLSAINWVRVYWLTSGQNTMKIDNIVLTTTNDSIPAEKPKATKSADTKSSASTAGAAGGDMFYSASGWSEGVTLKDGVLTLNNNLSATHLEGDLYNKMISFKLKTDVSNTDKWSGFAVRQTTSAKVPAWEQSGSCYIVVFKKDIIELQKFYKGQQIYFKTDPNKVFTDSNKFYDIEFGAINEGEAVRLILKVDGKEIYNYLDTENVVKDAGNFALYGYTNPISIQAAAKAQEPVKSPKTGDAGALVFVLTGAGAAAGSLLMKRKHK